MSPLTNEEQAQELSNTVRCRLEPSPVHGVGVFAMRDIKKGEPCHCGPTVKPNWYTIKLDKLRKCIGVTHPEIIDIILERWPHIVNGKPFLSPNYDARLILFMNHSETPNYDPITDTALSDIEKGDELFEDYRVVPNYRDAYPWIA